MLRKKREGLEWLEFELLADIPGLKHGVFTRQGGASQEPYGSLNTGGECGDEATSVTCNRQKIQHLLGVQHLISGRQVHGATIALVESPIDLVQMECDGLTTCEKGIGLMIKHADCQAAIFYDPIHHALCCVHAGWRGNVQNMYSHAMNSMKGKYNSDPRNILACISPSLGPDFSEFKNYKVEFPEQFWEFQIRPNFFNLWDISRKQLLDCGILPHHIEIASICTYANERDFFSYRRDKVTGRNATVAALF